MLTILGALSDCFITKIRYLKSKYTRPGQAGSILGRALSSLAVARQLGDVRRKVVEARTLLDSLQL